MALPAVIYDDIELWACTYTRTALAARSEPYTDEVFVSNEIPLGDDGEPVRHNRMIIFRRDGGGRSRRVFDNPRLTADVWGADKDEAVDLARLLAAVLESAPGDEQVKTCTVAAGPNRVPEPSGQSRVLLSFNVSTLGRDLA